MEEDVKQVLVSPCDVVFVRSQVIIQVGLPRELTDSSQVH